MPGHSVMSSPPEITISLRDERELMIAKQLPDFTHIETSEAAFVAGPHPTDVAG
jgi:hypothetical protein